MIALALYDAMLAQGWTGEGIVFCAVPCFERMAAGAGAIVVSTSVLIS